MMNSSSRPTGTGSPSSSSKSGLLGDNKVKFVISMLIPIVGTLIVVYQFILPNYVTKADFTKNVGGVATDMGTLKTEVGGMQATVNSLSDSINNKVADGVSKANSPMSAQIATMQTQITNMAGTVSALPKKDAVDTISAKVDGLAATQATQIDGKLSGLSSTVLGLQYQTSNLTQEVVGLKSQVSALVSQQNLANINISAYGTAVVFTSGNSTPIGQVIFTNTATTAITFTPKLVLSSAATLTSLTASYPDAIITYGVNMATFTFPSVTLAGGDGMVKNPSITLTTAPSPNVWTVAWSRQ